MEWNDIVDVLKVITWHDRRTIGYGDVVWWHAQSSYGEWPGRDFVVAAIMKHGAEKPGVWLEPGHITEYWREVRQDANKRFIPPPPTQANLDNPEAQQRDAKLALEVWVAEQVEAFVAPARKHFGNFATAFNKALHATEVKDATILRRR